MTKAINTVYYPSMTNVLTHSHNFMFNSMGIDTIELIAHRDTAIKMTEAMGLKALKNVKGTPIHDKVKKVEETEAKTEVFKLSNQRVLCNYMMITTHTPLLIDLAKQHKKAKDEFCLITFAGLHQPSSTIKSDTMKSISQFLKRKTFKLYSLDIAIDHQTDHHAINYGRKESFKWSLMPLSRQGVTPKGSSLYINNPNHPSISKILYYDKYHKERYYHKKAIDEGLEHWKRLEVTFTFDVTKKENKGFKNYMDGLNFVDDLYEIDEIATKAGIKSYDQDYLNYQINSLLDNRTMNNKASKAQFNSVESLERFKLSDFRQFTIQELGK